jgi:hypothetical protein
MLCHPNCVDDNSRDPQTFGQRATTKLSSIALRKPVQEVAYPPLGGVLTQPEHPSSSDALRSGPLIRASAQVSRSSRAYSGTRLALR